VSTSPHVGTGPRVLLIAPRWTSAGVLAEGLSSVGCEVHRLLDLRGIFVSDEESQRRRAFSWPDRRFASTTRINSVLDGDLTSTVERLTREHRIDIVLPIFEPAIYELWRHPPELGGAALHPPTQPWQRDLVRSKRAMSDAARAWGVDVPGQRSVRCAQDITAGIAELGLPIVLKDVVGGGGARVEVCDTKAEVHAALARITSVGGEPPILQEFIVGPTYLAGGLFDEGRAVRVYTGMKVEQWPPRVGPSAVLRSVEAPVLVDELCKVMAGLRWTGLVSTDFIGRPDGSFAFIEVNPRPWGTLGAAVVAGVDLTTPYAELLRGGHPGADLRVTADVDYRTPVSRVHQQVKDGSVAELVALLRNRELWSTIPVGDRGEVVHATLRRWLRTRRQH
jgi:hypothetical protein